MSISEMNFVFIRGPAGRFGGQAAGLAVFIGGFFNSWMTGRLGGRSRSIEAREIAVR
jgi:hypothetical protein